MPLPSRVRTRPTSRDERAAEEPPLPWFYRLPTSFPWTWLMLPSSRRASRLWPQLLPSRRTTYWSRLELPRFWLPCNGLQPAHSRKRVQQQVPTGVVVSNLLIPAAPTCRFSPSVVSRSDSEILDLARAKPAAP